MCVSSFTGLRTSFWSYREEGCILSNAAISCPIEESGCFSESSLKLVSVSHNFGLHCQVYYHPYLSKRFSLPLI